MEILDKKLKQVSRVNVGMSEANLLASLPNLQRKVNFLSLRNLLSNELFFTFLNLQQFFIFFKLDLTYNKFLVTSLTHHDFPFQLFHLL